MSVTDPSARGWGQQQGAYVKKGRALRAESQAQTASAIGCNQSQLSKFERGEREPSFSQVVQFARHFGLPLQWFLDGRLEPRGDRHALRYELVAYGIHDLQVATPLDPVGAFRGVEEVLCRSLDGRPDPRILEALPVLVLLNGLQADLLIAHARRFRVLRRTALVCDVAQHFYQSASWARPFAHDYAESAIIRFLDEARQQLDQSWTEPAIEPRVQHPIWKRWKSDVDTTLEEFESRCSSLLQESRS